VAAIKVPELYALLQQSGCQVKVVATRAALYFFDPAALDPLQPDFPERNREVVILDEDEWPGLEQGRRWQRGEPVLHIRLRRWADLFLIAPLDANTLAKLAGGLCDNCLTCVWRAWEPERPVVLAPAMNTLMWQHRLTARHLRQLAADAGAPGAPAGLDQDGVVDWINQNCRKLRVLLPQCKLLADGDVGMGAMADVAEIGAAVRGLLPTVPQQ
jgi:phosphopantothenoylcysteine decarboxylase